jgi:hypothetical protein
VIASPSVVFWQPRDERCAQEVFLNLPWIELIPDGSNFIPIVLAQEQQISLGIPDKILTFAIGDHCVDQIKHVQTLVALWLSSVLQAQHDLVIPEEVVLRCAMGA